MREARGIATRKTLAMTGVDVRLLSTEAGAVDAGDRRADDARDHGSRLSVEWVGGMKFASVISEAGRLEEIQDEMAVGG